MIEDHQTLTEDEQGPAPLVFTRAERSWRSRFRRPRKRSRPRVRKRRLLAVTVAFLGVAGISAVFGMLTAIASDLPQLENRVEFRSSVDSYLYDATGKPIGVLAPPTKMVLVNWNTLNANRNMVNAIVSVEDKRFWTSSGIDIRSLIRAGLADLTGGPVQGASTIPEEFVKNVLKQENNRTIFEKLREAGLAFQLVQHWKRSKIITQYLNAIYFGNGATGVEAAARTYFGKQYGYNPSNPGGEPATACGDPDVLHPKRKYCVEMLTPAQAALLAGMVANPSAFDPLLHPQAARERRDLVLQDMYQQGYIKRWQYERGLTAPLPTADQIQQPQEPAAAPYFTSWVRPQVISALEHEGLSPAEAEHEAYYGGLKIRLSINLSLQTAAQTAVDQQFPPGSKGPTATLVAIDNRTGEVRAMVSGDGNYQQMPFNLATLGYRQPGSSFKIFTLAAALTTGKYGPNSLFDSKAVALPYYAKTHTSAGPPAPVNTRSKNPGVIEYFPVHNFANEYVGPETLQAATMRSDNSVFAQLGMKVGTKRIARYAKEMGIRSPITTFPSMILGGAAGVSALDMAHAYQTEAAGGVKMWNPVLGDINQGPIGIASITGCTPCREHKITNAHPTKTRVYSPTVAAEIHSMLRGPVSPYGTAPIAAIPGVDVAGKTGTTTQYVDAWFVGWTPELTVAVWAGYPNSGKPMLTEWHGHPVEGGTFPALIWHNFMVNALQILSQQASAKSPSSASAQSTVTPAAATPSISTVGAASSTTTPSQATPTTSNTTTTPVAPTGQTTSSQTGAGTSGSPGTTQTTPIVGSTTTTPATGVTPAGGGTSGTGATGTTGTTGGSGLP